MLILPQASILLPERPLPLHLPSAKVTRVRNHVKYRQLATIRIGIGFPQSPHCFRARRLLM